MAAIDTALHYALTNSYTGPGKLLAISTTDSSPQILADSSASPPPSAQWYLTETDIPQYYYLHTVAAGEAQALDVVNSGGATGSTALHLAETGRYSGQFWRFDPVAQRRHGRVRVLPEQQLYRAGSPSGCLLGHAGAASRDGGL